MVSRRRIGRGLLVSVLVPLGVGLVVAGAIFWVSRSNLDESDLTPAPTPTSTPVLTPTLAPEPTPTSTPVPTLAPVPTPTSTPVPTPTPTPIPTPTPTPTPTPHDERYGVILHTNDPVKQQYFLDTLGTKWFIDFRATESPVPAGHTKVVSWMGLEPPSAAKVAAIAARTPGAVWYLHGEANRRWPAAEGVGPWRDMYMLIKAADPTAKVTSPSMLHWDFTCIGCGGYTSGHEWMNEFRLEWDIRYGGEPPFDVWAIDAYPLDWLNLPTDNHQIVIDQVQGMRDYMNTFAVHAGKPIWITELSLHWGWDGLQFDEQGFAIPAGTYQTERVIGYFAKVYDWLEANSAALNVERWFTFITYADLLTGNRGAYSGVSLFDGPDQGAALTVVGEFYKSRSGG